MLCHSCSRLHCECFQCEWHEIGEFIKLLNNNEEIFMLFLDQLFIMCLLYYTWFAWLKSPLLQEHSFDLQKNNFPTIPFLPLAWKSCMHNRFVSLVKMQCLVFLFGTWCLLLKGHSWNSVLCDKPKGCFKKPKNKEYWVFFTVSVVSWSACLQHV